jgi:hypothetical protein
MIDLMATSPSLQQVRPLPTSPAWSFFGGVCRSAAGAAALATKWCWIHSGLVLHGAFITHKPSVDQPVTVLPMMTCSGKATLCCVLQNTTDKSAIQQVT